MSKEYRYNDSGCCENPNSEIIYECDSFLCRIRTSCKNGKWTYGYTGKYKGTMTGCGGTSSGCCFNKYRKELVFETKQKARESAAKYLREYFKENGDHPNGNTNSNVLIALQEVFTPQLEIFVA